LSGPSPTIGIEDDGTYPSIRNAIIWPNCRVGGNATIQDAILGRQCHVGRYVSVNGGAVLGDKTTLTDFSKA